MNCPTVANAPACFGALQKRRLGRAACVRGQRLERGHEASFAAVVGANMVNGVRPFGAAARPLIAATGVLEVCERRVVILALRLVHDAHSLGTPEAGCEAWLSLLPLLRGRVAGVVAPPF